jgi:hypothetical protein
VPNSDPTLRDLARALEDGSHRLGGYIFDTPVSQLASVAFGLLFLLLAAVCLFRLLSWLDEPAKMNRFNLFLGSVGFWLGRLVRRLSRRVRRG